jgi:hypothetical protein
VVQRKVTLPASQKGISQKSRDMCALEGGTGKRQSVFRYNAKLFGTALAKPQTKGDNSVVSPARQEAAARRARRKKEGRKIVMALDWKLGVWPLLVTFLAMLVG